jgi:hypothetical protein
MLIQLVRLLESTIFHVVATIHSDIRFYFTLALVVIIKLDDLFSV